MDITLTNFSIVVIAQAHNPTILNPDFLKNNNIVEAALTPKIVICTMPVAQVVYEEGISIVAEFERLQFIDTSSERIPENSPIPQIAARYIETLPHVRYTAAGINFSGHYLFKDKDSARSFLSGKFIKEGPWLQQEKAADIGLRFIYAFENQKKTISLEPGEIVRSENEKLPVILVNANYHFDASEGKVEPIKSFISDWPTSFRDFSRSMEMVFPEV